MKGKIYTILFAALMVTLAFTPRVKAAANIGIYGYVDKVQYKYGDTGTLKIWIMNEGDEALILHNITVYYPWNMVLPWEGNYTMKEIEEVISIGGNKTYSFDFTVPNDRGAISSVYDISDIEVIVVTNEVVDDQSIPISIANPPVNMEVQDMANLVTLLTVQIIITIIATLIIAAAIFLSGRRPGVTWQREE